MTPPCGQDGSIGGASVGQLPLCPMPCHPVALPQLYCWKMMCPLDPSCPLSQRKVYVKIHDMCQDIAQSVVKFFIFPVANGQSTCCELDRILILSLLQKYMFKEAMSHEIAARPLYENIKPV